MAKIGVFSINFNGGEPLKRPDLLTLAERAKSLGFDIHLNTNATLIDECVADRLARLFPSICTSVLSSVPERHDRFVGAQHAFDRMRKGVALLLDRGVKIEINVCTFTENCNEVFDIAAIMAAPGVHVFCVTRFILNSLETRHYLLGPNETLRVLDALERIQAELPTYKEVKLPGPVPFCELPAAAKSRLARWNTPCQVGYGLCRISPTGLVTPCPLSDEVMGDVRKTSFADIWRSTNWNRFATVQHLPSACRGCPDLPACRGGCVGYDDNLVRCGLTPQTQKWRSP
jgi:radical SAM protein with 4Fe4S-binding SPASM domain